MEDRDYFVDDSVTLRSDPLSSEGSKQGTPEPGETIKPVGPDRHHLKHFCNLMEALFSKCFVYGVYRSLQLNLPVDSQDVEAVVTGICGETVLEIDITRFIQMICGHVKEFSFRFNLEQQQQQQSENDNNSRPSSAFPLETLQKHNPCEPLQPLHTSIKDQFRNIIQQYFRAVPAQPDYYYFCPLHLQSHMGGDDHGGAEGVQHHEHNDHQLRDAGERSLPDHPDDAQSTNLQTYDIEFTSDAGKGLSSPFQPRSERTSLLSLLSNMTSEDSSLNNNNNENEDEEEEEEDGGVSVIENDSSLSPLFVHLTCTLKDRGNVDNVSLRSLPTCLSEVSECLKSPDLDLSTLQVTLDVLCLTLPPEIENPVLGEGEQNIRTTSYCSTSSPIPESDTLKMAPDDTESLISANSDIPCDDSIGVLRNLPNFQYQAITSCVDKVKWMLQDEIASAALTSYPLNSATLEMVASHVKSSMGCSLCCVHQEVPLNFVFGTENSLNKFLEVFKRMSLLGYHLNKEEDFYYLALDTEVKTANSGVSSSASCTVAPPRGLVGKPLNPVPGSLYRDDSTQLMQMSKMAEELRVNITRRLSSNSLADDSSSLVSGIPEVRGETPFFPKLPKALVFRDDFKHETGTTNDEAELEEQVCRRKGRFRIYRRQSIRSTTKDKISIQSPLCIGAPDNMMLNSNVVKPIALPGTVQNIVIQNLTTKPDVSMQEGATKTEEKRSRSESTSTVATPTPDTLIESSLESSKELSGSFHLHSESRTAFNRSTPRENTHKPLENSKVTSPSNSVEKSVADGSEMTTSDQESLEVRERADSLDLPPVQSRDNSKGTISPFRRLQSANESSSSTPFMFSGHVSNTEDGYEGDSSESDSEWDHLGALDTRQPTLPPFWLLMCVVQDRVSVYFHLRQRVCPDDPELRMAKDVMRHVVRSIKSICKNVNQMLLLQELFDSHMCNQLLVSESSGDIWKPDDTANSVSNYGPGRLLSADELDDSYEYPASGYLEASLKFKPGAFECSMVWQTHFYFHPRLSSGPGRAGRSRGIQAMRSVLDSFSVINRKNMFVLKEGTGSVFYFRLHETSCAGHPFVPKADEESPITRSRSSSIHSLQQKKTPVDIEEDFSPAEFRPRLNSALSDKDQSHDSLSITSKTSSSQKSHQCIVLQVHGIGEVGSEIKDELVQVLQNRLDDAVLDVITSMLFRNPMSKLTPEDVQFIQRPGRETNLVLHFTIHVHALPYLRPLRYYLQQNFRGFLHSPNYTDNKLENHFRPYGDEVLCDEDVFLYSRHQASGTSGNKGIACILLSMVNGKGRPVGLGNCPVPIPTAYMDMPQDFELEELTATSLYKLSSQSSSPGPLALIKVQLWCVGKVATEQLQDKICQAVRQSLWDLLLEFCVLTAPIAEINQAETSCSFSAPTTPIKARRTGRVIVDPLNSGLVGRVPRSFPPLSIQPQPVEAPSFTPEVLAPAKIRSPVASPTESISFFKFGSTSGQATSSSSGNNLAPNDFPPSPLSPNIKCPQNPSDTRSLPCDTGDRGRLLHIFHTGLKSFLEFGIKLDVPTVQRREFVLKNRHQVPVVLSQFQAQLNDLTPDVMPKLFMQLNGDYVPYLTKDMGSNSWDQVPGGSQLFVAVGRNINLWKAFMGFPEFACYLETAFLRHQKGFQKYQPLLLSPDKDVISLGPGTSRTTTPISGVVSPVPIQQTSFSPSTTSGSRTSPVDLNHPYFVPRQRLLLLLLVDKHLDIYLYNWTNEMSNSIFRLLENLVTWNNQRSLALDSLVSQKLGIFIHQPLQRTTTTTAKSSTIATSQKDAAIIQAKDIVKEKKVPTKLIPTPATSQPPLQLEDLLSHCSPPATSISTGTVRGSVGVQGSSSGRGSLGRRTGSHSLATPSGPPVSQHVESQVLRDCRPPRPVHLCSYRDETDAAIMYGLQLRDIRSAVRRTMDELYRVWMSRDPSIPFMEKQMVWMKQVGRLSHFCLTPLLFSPTWRWRLAPVRDHTLEPATIHFNPGSGSSSDKGSTHLEHSTRSRHSSGSSVKNSEPSQSIVSSIQNRIRRVSGSAPPPQSFSPSSAPDRPSSLYHNSALSIQQHSNGGKSSPKPRRSYQDETWHITICTNYIQEYIQYLQTLGFVAIQTKGKSRSSSKEGSSRSGVSSVARNSVKGLPVFYLVKNMLGGLLVFEVGFCEPYVYAYLYSLDGKRLQGRSETSRSQFVTTFLDELDRIKMVMHMHSFTYDFHLRTIHSCISGRQLLFRPGYHLSSFLDDFIKYYQKSPNFARNLIGGGTLIMPNTRMSGAKLYDHVITRNQLYGMTVVRMVPIYQGDDHDTEYALVELSSHKVSYKDANDHHQVDNFDMGLLVTHEHSVSDHNILVLRFYILLTSQRDLYPKLFNFGAALGSFRPVRLSTSSSHSQSPSRKTSTVLGPVPEAHKEFEASGSSDVIGENASAPSRRVSSTVPPTMCDEEVMYLGYFSSHETFMLKFLEERTENTRSHLEAVLSRAEVHCCRDLLWNKLMPGDRMQDGSSTPLPTMTFSEFMELLELVTSVPISVIDPDLTPYLNMHISWYQSLSRVLATKYPDTHRYFESSDTPVRHLAVMDPNCTDSFMRLTLNQTGNRAELCHVFKENLLDKDHCPDKPNFRVRARQKLCEDFVNTCCFHLWCGLLG